MRVNQYKFMEIADCFAKKISAMQPGDRLPTADEIKNEYNTTIATASRVIKELRQRGLIHSKPGAGSYVARLEKHEFVICVTPPVNISRSEHWHQFHSSICNYCSVIYDQYTVLTIPPERLEEQIESLKNRSLDLAGVIFFRDIKLYQRFQPFLRKKNIMTVFFGSSTFKEMVKGSGCFYDEDNIIHLILEHLQRNGHRNIGCIYDSQSNLDAMRHERYENLMKKSGSVPASWSLDTGGLHHEWFDDVLSLPAKKQFFRRYIAGLSALIVLHDNQASIIMQIISRMGFSIPDDISIVSIDNLDLCNLMRPRLDSIDLKITENATSCIDIISGKVNHSILGEMKLQLRDSVKFINYQ